MTGNKDALENTEKGINRRGTTSRDREEKRGHIHSAGNLNAFFIHQYTFFFPREKLKYILLVSLDQNGQAFFSFFFCHCARSSYCTWDLSKPSTRFFSTYI